MFIAIGFVGSNMVMEIVDGKEREIVCVLEIGFEIVDHVESSDRGFEIVGNHHDDHVLYRLWIPCRNQELDYEPVW